MGTVDDLTLFLEVIEAGSLSAASRRTGIPKSTLSRRIGDLENELGVNLFNRGPGNFSVTEIGLSISKRGQIIKEELDAIKALAEDSSQNPAGILRISCPAILTDRLVAEFAVRFAATYRDVRLTLDTSVGAFDPVIGHYDLIIQPTHDDMVDSELIRQKLVTVSYRLVASPGAMQAIGPISSPADLENCYGIGWAADAFEARWKLFDRDGNASEVNIALKFSSNNLGVIRQAALQGLGLARLPFGMCEADQQEGRLVLPLPDWSPPPVTICALYPSRRSLTLAGRLFIAGLGRHLQERIQLSHREMR